MEKLYYAISEVAEILGESTSLVRFWSDKFKDFIKPMRNKKGNRLFTPEDVANFKIIYHLVKERGMTLDGALQRMRDNRTGEDKSLEVRRALTAIRQELLQIRDQL